MPAIIKKETRLQLKFVANHDHSIHAGLVAVEAMARRFGLWEKVRALKCLDPRRDKKRGYSPEVIIGQLIYAFCSGGGCLSDSEALNDDPWPENCLASANLPTSPRSESGCVNKTMTAWGRDSLVKRVIYEQVHWHK